MSMPPPSFSSLSAKKSRSPPLRPTGPNSLMSDLQLPASSTTSQTTAAPPSGSGNGGASVPTPSSSSHRVVPAPPPQRARPGPGPSSLSLASSPTSFALAAEEEQPSPVEPAVLADAMQKIGELRLTRNPSTRTSPSVSGASSPGVSGTPRVLPGSGGEAARVLNAASGLLEKERASQTMPGTPHFGARSDMLKTLDESTKVIRQSAMAPNRAPSVSGIGAVVEKPDYSEAKIVVAMVGLPARGKSYLSNRLMRYLRWLEYEVKVFNVGQLRRSKARAEQQAGKGKVDHSATWFSHANTSGNAAREQLANESLEMLIDWLKESGGNVGIMDATNSTFERREKIRARIAQEPTLQLLFLESFCNDPAVIAANVALKVSSGDPDYAGMSKEDAEADFRKRIAAYESVYETITEPGISFCRILNVGERVTINRIDGYLQSRIAFYLMNLHLKPRSIYLSRHGESMYNVEGKIGGDSDLSPQGYKYAHALPALVKDNVGDLPLEVWTSTLQRTIQTGSMLPFEHKTWKSLDELDAGVCDGMTYEEIEVKYPEDYEARDEDKFNYRYRGGESYRDVVVRLEPVIMELERQENILIIAHQAILRCLYAYFMGLNHEQLPYVKIPLHTLIKITPMAYGCHEDRYPLPIAAVDTHRPKPAKGRKNSIVGDGGGSDVVTNAPVSRDYFGDTSALASESGHDAKVKAAAVSDKLLSDLDKGLLTPKAADQQRAA